MRRFAIALSSALLLGASGASAWADGDADDFKQNCASCHTIGGGRLVGPDLKDVTKRQQREWLVRFIRDPQAVIGSGDAYAVKLLAEHRNVAMPPVAGMTDKRAGQLLDLIEAEGKLEKSRFASSGVSDRAFTPEDVSRGRRLYLGLDAPTRGGPACIACHQAGEAAPLGGGRLGPDLSDVWTRLGGRKGLGAWLLGPATPTMKPLFALHADPARDRSLDAEKDVLPLLAFLQEVERAGPPPDTTSQRLVFVILGVAGAAAGLVLMDFAWRRRLTGVRSRLVGGRV